MRGRRGHLAERVGLSAPRGASVISIHSTRKPLRASASPVPAGRSDRRRRATCGQLHRSTGGGPSNTTDASAGVAASARHARRPARASAAAGAAALGQRLETAAELVECRDAGRIGGHADVSWIVSSRPSERSPRDTRARAAGSVIGEPPGDVVVGTAPRPRAAAAPRGAPPDSAPSSRATAPRSSSQAGQLDDPHQVVGLERRHLDAEPRQRPALGAAAAQVAREDVAGDAEQPARRRPPRSRRGSAAGPRRPARTSRR